MATTIPFRLGPEFTPTAVRRLLIYTICISLGSAIINPFFTSLLGIPGPQEWFSLSWWGIQHYLLWQPLSYLFVHPMGFEGINFSYFITLLFHSYIIWVIGSDVCQRIKEKSFINLYLTCGVLSGLASLLTMSLLGQYAVFAGPFPAILGLLICWSFFQPEQELLVFFLFSVKAKWISLGITGIALLSSLSNLQFAYFILYFTGAFTGYIYALVAWGVHSPFPPLYKTELAVIRTFQKLYAFFPKKKTNSKSKIVNIKTGESEEDEAFIDSILEKISRHGENSLTFSERERMKKISQNKSRLS